MKDLDQNLPQPSDEDTLSHVEHEQDENEQMPMPIVYKKRARVKFTQEQVRHNFIFNLTSSFHFKDQCA